MGSAIRVQTVRRVRTNSVFYHGVTTSQADEYASTPAPIIDILYMDADIHVVSAEPVGEAFAISKQCPSEMPNPIPADWKDGRMRTSDDWFQKARDDTLRFDAATCCRNIHQRHWS